jgi:hypothetical protein
MSVRPAPTEAIDVLARDVEDEKGNVTRFGAVGREDAPRTGTDRTSLCIHDVPNERAARSRSSGANAGGPCWGATRGCSSLAGRRFTVGPGRRSVKSPGRGPCLAQVRREARPKIYGAASSRSAQHPRSPDRVLQEDPMADPDRTDPSLNPTPTNDKPAPPRTVVGIGVGILAGFAAALAAFAWLWSGAGQRVLAEDVRLLLLSFLGGCIGAFVHQATSFATFVGNRQLTDSWRWWYLVRVPVGGAIALLAYFVYAAGAAPGAAAPTPLRVAALSGLAGLFSRQVVDKLSDVLDALFPSRANQARGDTAARGAGRTAQVIDHPARKG